MNGEVPLVNEPVASPSQIPLQLAALLVTDKIIAAGSLIVTLFEERHPVASVAVTV